MGVGDTGPKIRGFVLSVMVGRTARAQRSPLIISLKKLQCGDNNIYFWARNISEYDLSGLVKLIILIPTCLQCEYLIL